MSQVFRNLILVLEKEGFMTNKHVLKSEKKDVIKDETKEKIIHKHHYLGLRSGFSFTHHSHGRVNNHSIGFNHEPGTL